MKLTQLLTFALASVAAASNVNNLDASLKTEFQKFAARYHPSLKADSDEFVERLKIFEQTLVKIREHNADTKKSYKLGINKWSASTDSEKRKVLGRRADFERQHRPNAKNVMEEHEFEMKPVSELPESIDWREKGMGTATKDQGHCGSCFAFAASEMLEDYLFMTSGELFNLSPQMAASCTPNPEHCGGSGGCMGGTAEIVFDYLAGGGQMVQEYQDGYRSYFGDDYECNTPEDGNGSITVEGFTFLQGNNYTELMNAVAQVGPISIGVDASEWHNYESGVFTGCNQQNPDVNHAVVLYGYGIDEETGMKYWNIRNSWSPTYGEHGYIRIYRDDGEGENCGIQLNPQDNDACEGDHIPRKVCGTCGILAGSSYLRNVQLK